MCPQCLSDNVRVEPYEASDPDTGYRDYGVMVRCLEPECGAVSTAEEVDAAMAAQEDENA